MTSVSGSLVLAATPLGDARDGSARLVSMLSTADVIAAEDTRRLRALCATLGVTPRGRIVSFYDAVEIAKVPRLIEAMRSGSTVLLVTDAGMPSVSDPGFRLASACVAADVPVTCVPGPSAVTTALAVSGLPCERFCFDGFPPRKPAQRRAWFAELATERRAVVFFESPHRIGATMADAAEVLDPQRRVAICRELTKTYEEVIRGTLAELADIGELRGEITVVLEGAAAPGPVDIGELVPQVHARVAEGERLKDVAGELAEANGVSKKALYDAAVQAK